MLTIDAVYLIPPLSPLLGIGILMLRTQQSPIYGIWIQLLFNHDSSGKEIIIHTQYKPANAHHWCILPCPSMLPLTGHWHLYVKDSSTPDLLHLDTVIIWIMIAQGRGIIILTELSLASALYFYLPSLTLSLPLSCPLFTSLEQLIFESLLHQNFCPLVWGTNVLVKSYLFMTFFHSK